MENISMDSRVTMTKEDFKALMMMKKITGEDGKTYWICNVCDITSKDKTRIRKHIKSKHISNSEDFKQENEEMVENIFS